MEDGIGVIAVIGRDIVGDHRIRLELVGDSLGTTQSGGFIDIGAVRVESESVGPSQTRARLEWGRSIICVESRKQGISEGGVRRR